ncbi:Actin CyI, cytoplasmic Precursor [Channa argus]|uniref:Actin CyI, cytoplasmic n=1 Tax=Channa argus TaxID=215402 RepID=A0A6G1QJ80_CHAAH|nr:Actin CyI, cytoplasmic Precursor [Channa argus]
MSRHATDVQDSVQESVPSPPLPADHVLNSGAVLFPGAFDQHGCHLIVFPVEGQAKLSSELSKAEVVDFINYFHCLHNKKQEKQSLVSVVADLRHALLPTARFIAEMVLLLEHHKRTVHSVYIIQPKKKDVVKLLLKLLAPSKLNSVSFKRVFLKEISELSNHIDRSQLTASLGGYFIYCHQSWVAFIKEIDSFVQEFLSVVQRLPSSISTLQALSRLPLPATYTELQHFCSTNDAKFQQLRRELGLDELLRHCESVVEKLCHPEMEPCYQAMVGTPLFTHTAFDMLQNHSRLTAARDKVELLWQQTFSKAQLQLQVFQLRDDALRITEQIEMLLQSKLQPYNIEIAKDSAKAVTLVSQFEASIHTPAMALVRCAEDVIHTLAEILPFDSQSREHWVLDLERLKDKLYAAVHFILQTLRAVCNYHHYYNKVRRWYTLILRENFLQELLSGVNGTQRQKNCGSVPAWRHKLSNFLKKNPSPSIEELLQLDHLSNVIPDDEIQQAGKKMSQRCMTLRKLLISSAPVAIGHLQLALQWQYELLCNSHVNQTSAQRATSSNAKNAQDSSLESPKSEHGKEVSVLEASPSNNMAPGNLSAEHRPPSLSSFDSGFDGAGSTPLEAKGGRENVEVLPRLAGTRDYLKAAMSQADIHKDNISSFTDSGDHGQVLDFSSVENSSRASIQIIPKLTVDSINLEIKVKRSAAMPNNPWLSLPVDDLENSYTVTITQNATPQTREIQSYDPSDSHTKASHTYSPQEDSTDTGELSSTHPREPENRDWRLRSQSNLEDPDLSHISNILSSTIADERDKSISSTEGIPTLLWDSYDLHPPSDFSGIDLLLKDWDVKEQEGLSEVEKVLDRADEILKEEENILAQEAVLEALLRSEDRHHCWPLWDSEDQCAVMSSSESTEVGVLGLEDCPDPTKSNNLSENTSTGSVGETKASEEDWHCADADLVTSHSGADLLMELRNIRVLDELIIEENLKVHEPRCSQANLNNELSGSKPLCINGSSSVSNEQEVFQLEMEKEKREVKKLEKSFEIKDTKSTRKTVSRKVVKCSLMEKVRTEDVEEQALFDELMSDSWNRSQGIHSISLDQNEERCKAENVKTEIGPDGGKGTTIHSDLLECQELSCSELNPEIDTELFRSAENVITCVPEAPLTPNLGPDDGAFDPGGKSLFLPVPKPRKALLPVNNNPAEHETPHSTKLLDSALSSTIQDPGYVQLHLHDDAFDALPEHVTPAGSQKAVLETNVKEHSNNNNNHQEEGLVVLSEMNSKCKEDTSVAPALMPQTDLYQTVEIQTLSPTDEQSHQQSALHLPPEQSLEFDPGGRETPNVDLPHGVQSSEAMRVSVSGSTGVQAQLNINRIELMDWKTPIVLDTGSGLMKAGFADQDLPSVTFPTIIGMPKYEEIMNSNLEREAYIGHEAQHMRGVLTLRHPIKNGIVHNWDDMEKIWHHTFQQLCVDPEDHPVMLTEAAMNPLGNRQRTVEIMFECFSVPFTYVAMQAVLALYATGRSTGVVFESGDGVSHCVPVFEGYGLPHALQRFPLAGADVTMQLKKLLQEQGVCMRTTAEMEIVREMKEKCCCVAPNYDHELTQTGLSCREMHYTMPDGQIVTLGTERFRAPEILFKPDLIGREHHGMHESIFKSILSSDIDLRRCLLANIVLSGGNTLLPGLPERLQAEIKGLLPADISERVRVTSPKDRKFSVWSGGAILANLPTFSSAWISQEEYDEYGPQIVFRKCF